jgi:hypothetical protein
LCKERKREKEKESISDGKYRLINFKLISRIDGERESQFKIVGLTTLAGEEQYILLLRGSINYSKSISKDKVS